MANPGGNSGKITLTASLDDKLTAGLKGLQAVLDQLEKVLRQQKTATDAASGALKVHKDATDAARKATEAEVLTLKAKLAEIKGNKAEVDRYNKTLEQQKVDSIAAATGSKQLALEVTRLRKEVETATPATNKWNSAVSKLTPALAALGITLGLAGLVGIVKGAIGAAIDMEAAMVRVQKTTNLTDNEIKGLSREFVNLSTKLPVSAQELARIASIAGQLGVKGKPAISAFTSEVAKIAAVTGLTVDAAAEGMARLANIFHIPIPEIGRLASVLNELENNTTANSAQLLDLLQRMGSAGTTIGLTAAQIGGLAATLIDLGISTEVAGTGMSNVFIQMLAQADEFARQVGITVGEWRRLIEDDALGALNLWIEAFGRLDAAAQISALDDLGLDAGRVTNILLNLGGAQELVNKNVDIATAAFRENTSVNRELEVALRSTETQLTILWNSVKGLAISLGGTLKPEIDGAAGAMTFLFNKAREGIDVLKDTENQVSIVALGWQALKDVGGFLGAVIDDVSFRFAAFDVGMSHADFAAQKMNETLRGMPNTHFGVRDSVDEVTRKLIANTVEIEKNEVVVNKLTDAQKNAQQALIGERLELALKTATLLEDKVAIEKAQAALDAHTASVQAGKTGSQELSLALIEEKRQYEDLKKEIEATKAAEELLNDIKREQPDVHKDSNDRIFKDYEQTAEKIKDIEDQLGAKHKDVLDLKAANEDRYHTQRRQAQDEFLNAVVIAVDDARSRELVIDDARVAAIMTNNAATLQDRLDMLQLYIDSVRLNKETQEDIEREIRDKTIEIAVDEWDKKTQAVDRWYQDTLFRINDAERQGKISADQAARDRIDATDAMISQIGQIEADYDREHRSWIDSLKAAWKDWTGDAANNTVDMVGTFKNLLGAAGTFFKEAFVAVITLDIDRLASAFKNFASTILEEFTKLAAQIIASWAFAFFDIKEKIEGILDWIGEIFKKTKDEGEDAVFTLVDTLIGGLLPAVTTATLAWAGFNAQLAVSQGLMGGMTLGGIGGLSSLLGNIGGLISSFGGIGGGGIGTPGIVNSLGTIGSVTGKLGNILSSLDFGLGGLKGSIGSLLTAVGAPLAGAGFGVLGGQQLGKLLGLGPQGQNVAGGVLGGGLGVGLGAAALGLGPLGVGIAAILGGGAGGFLGSLFGGDKPHRKGFKLGTTFEGLILGDQGLFEPGEIDVFVKAVKRMSFDSAQQIAGSLEGTLKTMTTLWAQTFNKFPVGIREAISPAVAEANVRIAKAFDDILSVSRSDLQPMIDDLLRGASKKVSKQFRGPLEEAMRQLVEMVLPGDMGSGLADSIDVFIEKFSGVKNKNQPVFLESINTIIDALLEFQGRQDLFNPEDITGIFSFLNNIIDDANELKKHDIGDISKMLEGFFEFLNAATAFLQAQQDIIDADTMTSFELSLRRLNEQFQQERDTAEDLRLSFEKLDQAQKIQLRDLIDSFLAPLAEIDFNVAAAIANLTGAGIDMSEQFNTMVRAIRNADPEASLAAAQGAFDAAIAWFESLGDFAGIAETASRRLLEHQLSTVAGIMGRISELTGGAAVVDVASAIAAINGLIGQSQTASIEERAAMQARVAEALDLAERLNAELISSQQIETGDLMEEMARNITATGEERDRLLAELSAEEQRRLAAIAADSASNIERIMDLWRALQDDALRSQEEADAMMIDRLETIRAAIDAERLFLGEIIETIGGDIVTSLLATMSATERGLLGIGTTAAEQRALEAAIAEQRALEAAAAADRALEAAAAADQAAREAAALAEQQALEVAAADRAAREAAALAEQQALEAAIAADQAAREAAADRAREAAAAAERSAREAAAIADADNRARQEIVAAADRAREAAAAADRALEAAIAADQAAREAAALADQRAQEAAADRAREAAAAAERFAREAADAEALASTLAALAAVDWAALVGGIGAGGFAHGLDFVPADNFPIRAHRGEAVITARGNEALGKIEAMLARGAGGNITVIIQPAPVNLDGRQVSEVVFNVIRAEGEGGRPIVPTTAVYTRR